MKPRAIRSKWNSTVRRVHLLLRSLSDLVIVVGYVMFAFVFLTHPALEETLLARFVGLPLLFFVPGYAIISALFPETQSEPDDTGYPVAILRKQRIDLSLLERGLLSFGFSVVTVSLVTLSVILVPLRLRPFTVVSILSLFTVCTVFVAGYRRSKVPRAVRFDLSLSRWRVALESNDETKIGFALNVLLVVSIVVAVASVSYAIVGPKEPSSYTTLTVLNESENGSLIAGNYPTEFVRGEPRPVMLDLSNHERQPMEYVVVSQLQRVETNENTTTVVERETVQTFSVRVDEGETRTIEHRVRPTMTGSDLRLVFLIYTNDAPQNPTIDNAYRDAHIWISVSNQTRD